MTKRHEWLEWLVMLLVWLSWGVVLDQLIALFGWPSNWSLVLYRWLDIQHYGLRFVLGWLSICGVVLLCSRVVMGISLGWRAGQLALFEWKVRHGKA